MPAGASAKKLLIGSLVTTLCAAAILLPGLGSYGLWDPPPDWNVTVERDWKAGPKTKKVQVPETFSEIAVAEDARARIQRPKDRKGADAPQRLHVPPLGLDASTWSMKIFGVYDWAARLPMAICGILLVALTFLAGAWLVDWKIGLLSAFILLSWPSFLLQSRLASSHVPAVLVTTMAVVGIGLLLSPGRTTARTWTGGLLAFLGLSFGRSAAGPLLGLIMPLTVGLLLSIAYLVPVGISNGEEDRKKYWMTTGVLATILVILSGWMAWDLSRGGGWLTVIRPVAATKVLNFAGNKTPPSQIAVFDILFRRIIHGSFPWFGLVPIGLALSLVSFWPNFRKVSDSSDAIKQADDRKDSLGPLQAIDATRAERYLGVWLLVWMTAALVLGTYWNLRYADQPYLALPALALAAGFGLARLASSRSPRMLAGAVVAVLITLVMLHDFIDVPQALVQSVLDYRVQWPNEVPLKHFVALFATIAVVLYLLLTLVRPDGETVRWPENLMDWLGGKRPAAAMTRLASWSWLSGWKGLVGWPLAVGMALVDLAMGWVEAIILQFLGSFLFYPLWLAERIETKGLVGPKALFPGKERLILTELWKHLAKGTLVKRSFWGAIMALVLPVWLSFLPVRLFWYLLLAPLGALGTLLSWAMTSLVPTSSTTSMQRTWLMAAVGMVALSWGAYVSHGLLPELSRHFSPKAVLETYHKARAGGGKTTMALFRVKSRSASFYNAGKVITERELAAKFPWRSAHTEPLLAYLAQPERVFALVGSAYLGTLENKARRAGIPYYVLDAKSQWFLLVSNKLGPGEKDNNPLRRLVRNTPPKSMGRRIRAVFKNPSSSNADGDLVLLGVDMPRVIDKGHKFVVRLYFKVNHDLNGDWKVFIHFDGPGLRFFGDHKPLEGKYPTRYWTSGTYIVDPHLVPSSETSRIATPSGIYHVWMGLYHGDTRMTVLSGPKDSANRVSLGTVRVLFKSPFSCK